MLARTTRRIASVGSTIDGSGTCSTLAARLIERAQAAGAVRSDATTQDFGVVLVMVGAVMDAAEDVDPELWRRYLRVALQGLRPEGAPLEPLAVAAVEPTRMDELLVGVWERRHS